MKIVSLNERILYGFTLVELMLIVSVLSLLSSIVLVGLGAAKAKGRDAERKVEIQQLGAMLQLYFNDTGEMPKVKIANDGTVVWAQGQIDTSTGDPGLGSIGTQDTIYGKCGDSANDWPIDNPLNSDNRNNTLAGALKGYGYLSELPKDPINKKTGATTEEASRYCYIFSSHISSDGNTKGGCLWATLEAETINGRGKRVGVTVGKPLLNTDSQYTALGYDSEKYPYGFICALDELIRGSSGATPQGVGCYIPADCGSGQECVSGTCQ